jgi:hypothetical protein
LEIPASGGGSINNDTEGYGWFSGYATGVLPWRGPVVGFRAAALNNALCDGGASLSVTLENDAITAAKIASDAAAEIAAAVRTELTTELGRVDVAVSTRLASAGYTAPLDAAGTRTAVGLASANLDTQIATLATAAALAVVDGIADDILLDTAEIGAAGAGLTALATQASVNDIPTNAELAARTLAAADYATATNLATVDTVADAIKAKTDNLPSDPADQSVIIAATDAVLAAIGALASAGAIADAVLDEAVDGATTLRESLRLYNAALGGKVSGMAAGTPAFRDLADSKDRIVAVTDADGNRTAVVLDLS